MVGSSMLSLASENLPSVKVEYIDRVSVPISSKNGDFVSLLNVELGSIGVAVLSSARLSLT